MKFVIVGNGLAGITAASTISAGDAGAVIQIYTDEPHAFYLRPRLIEFLAGRLNLGGLYSHPREWYAKRGIEVHLASRVARLDVSGHRIVLEDDTEVSYERLLLAVGASPFVPPLPGMGKGVFTLRTIEDAVGIKGHAERCLAEGSNEAVVIGGGLLGLECANALTSLGLQVTVLEQGPWLLHKQVDQEGARVLEERIVRLGFGVIAGADPGEIVSDGGFACGVSLKDGRTLPAKLVLSAAGVRPNTDLARDAGLDVNRGIVVDGQLRTSEDHVYAAGDVAEYDGQLPCIIPAAVEQGKVAGADMLEPGSATYHGTVPSTTLKVVGLHVTSIGQIDGREERDQEFRKVDGAKGVYRKLVLREGRIVGAILLGDRPLVPTITKLIKEDTDVSRYGDDLMEDGFDWQTIAET